MTRQEAIKFLTLMRKAVSNFEEYGHDKASMVIECDKAEAIDMAISALSKADTTENPKCDLISRADAIEMAVDVESPQGTYERAIYVDDLMALPSAELPKGDLISRADVLKYPIRLDHYDEVNGNRLFVYGVESVIEYVESLPSADADAYTRITGLMPDAEPKWTCTANFVAEQLDRLRNMTDEEKWEFFRKFFGMGDAVHGEWIEREDWNGDYYYDCSVCGESFVLCDGTPSMNLYHYCPNCGARMKGGAE